MKEYGQTITLDKSEYREIPSSEQTIKPNFKRPEFKKPDVNPFKNTTHEERVRLTRLNLTRRQLTQIPILALVIPMFEVPENLPDLSPSNGFLDFINGIFDFIGLFLHDDEADQKKKAY
jgi:hypothetical protein